MQVKKRALLGQLSDMDLRLLRVFKAVVDCGGMSAAELELNISLSTISKHIKDLEQRLGLTLCQRGREGFAVTDEGLLIYQKRSTCWRPPRRSGAGWTRCTSAWAGSCTWRYSIIRSAIRRRRSAGPSRYSASVRRRFLCKCTWSRLIPLNAASLTGNFRLALFPCTAARKVYLIIRYSVRGCSYIAARSMNYFPPP